MNGRLVGQTVMVNQMHKILMSVPESVLRAQARASQPTRNVWLSANAGSGKTHVLTERVIRLLLAGTDPAQILCLTYTKAAASVMQTRIFTRLSQWAMLDDATLASQLLKLEGVPIDSSHLTRARRLFAQALETPGGLKIQTIHAFCESILHQFPLEANIAGHFEMLDDISALDLMRQARRKLIEKAWGREDDAFSTAFDLVLARVGETGLDSLFSEAIAKREALRKPLQQFNASGLAFFRQLFKHDENQDEASLAREIKRAALFSEEDLNLLNQYGGKATKNFVAKLNELKQQEDIREFIPLVKKAYFTSNAEKLLKYTTLLPKKVQEAAPEMLPHFLAKQERILALLDKVREGELISLNEAAYRLISYLNKTYAKLKQDQGLLDFDDLIHRTLKLLRRSHASRWVHYKLDSSIAHILIDEAQDTSPVQWQIIRQLADEFFAGVGASETNRTLFAVGDEKQSIYSFQGAAPENFAKSAVDFGKKARAAGKFFENLRLDFSFRSVPDILAAVDMVFANETHPQSPEHFPKSGEQFSGKNCDKTQELEQLTSPSEAKTALSATGERTVHRAVRAKASGEVDIWAALKPQDWQEPQDWRAQQDRQDEPPLVLARQIAETIEGWLKGGEAIIGQGRLMQPGDIIVLVRSRDRFVHALSRELKNRSIAVAGSDRLRLNEHIAVRDLMTLARFVLQPFDDLSLACTLKSPLFGMDEDALYQLAQGRGKGEQLYHSLERQASNNPKFAVTYTALTHYRALADVVPPYEFYSHILSEEGGRRKILSRLGGEASEVLDAFLDTTLAIQKKGLPGLQSFLESLDASAPEIKRELGDTADEVRIMTVHAAKGQEAAVVFLVDNGKQIWNANRAPKLMQIEGTPLWNPGKKYRSTILETALKKLEEREEQEYRRLLYVGMTRAEDRLIVCGYKSKKSPAGTWLDLVSDALASKAAPLLPPPAAGVEAHRFRLNPEQLALYQPDNTPQESPSPTSPPSFLFEKIEPLLPKPRPFAPSHAALHMLDEEETMGDVAITSLIELGNSTKISPSMAIRRGIVTHHLLQYLPDIAPEHRLDRAHRFIKQQLPDWSEDEQQKIEHDLFTLLRDDRLQRLFAPASRAEVALMGTLEINGVAKPISGQIDRLAVFEDEILIADFKTGRVPKNMQDIPDNYLLQMSLYRHLLRQIYPLHTIYALLIYTNGEPTLFQLDNEKLDRLLEKL